MTNEQQIKQQIGTELAMDMTEQYGHKFAQFYPLADFEYFIEICEDIRNKW